MARTKPGPPTGKNREVGDGCGVLGRAALRRGHFEEAFLRHFVCFPCMARANPDTEPGRGPKRTLFQGRKRWTNREKSAKGAAPTGGRPPRTHPFHALFSRDPSKSPSPPRTFEAPPQTGKAANNGFDRHGGGTYRMPTVWKVRRKPGNPCRTSFFSHLLRDEFGQQKTENFLAKSSATRTRPSARFSRVAVGLLSASVGHGRRRAFLSARTRRRRGNPPGRRRRTVKQKQPKEQT